MVNGTNEAGVTWYSVQQAAEIYRVHSNTIRARIKAGTIEHRQVERNGQLVYEVVISDDDAALLRDKEDRERMAETIAELRVQLGLAEAGRIQAEAESANLRRVARKLRHDKEESDKGLAMVNGVARTLRDEKATALKRIEEQAEEIGGLRAEATAVREHCEWVEEQNSRILAFLREAKSYYWTPGLRATFRRIFRPYRGFTRVP